MACNLWPRTHERSSGIRRAADVPALERVCHAGDEGRPTNYKYSLQVLSYLLIAARSARAVEYRDIQWKLACLEAHVDCVPAGVDVQWLHWKHR